MLIIISIEVVQNVIRTLYCIPLSIPPESGNPAKVHQNLAIPPISATSPEMICGERHYHFQRLFANLQQFSSITINFQEFALGGRFFHQLRIRGLSSVSSSLSSPRMPLNRLPAPSSVTDVRLDPNTATGEKGLQLSAKGDAVPKSSSFLASNFRSWVETCSCSFESALYFAFARASSSSSSRRRLSLRSRKARCL